MCTATSAVPRRCSDCSRCAREASSVPTSSVCSVSQRGAGWRGSPGSDPGSTLARRLDLLEDQADELFEEFQVLGPGDLLHLGHELPAALDQFDKVLDA